MIKTVAVAFRPDESSLLPTVEDLVRFLEESGVEPILPPGAGEIAAWLEQFSVTEDEMIKRADLVVVVGGDGTFLRAARLFAGAEKPLFGINRGKLGFLTEFNPDEFREHLSNVLLGTYTFSGRITLEAELRNHNGIERALFLNDAVLSKGSLSRPVRIDLSIDGVHLNTYHGDGLIVATPTGSTAYSLSAGGPLVSPLAGSVYLVTPICPHTLAMRPMVIPASSMLTARIESGFENLLLTIDGQEGISIGASDEINFKLSDKKIKVVTHPRKGFYTILREKLGWG
jgi:NAD+ kinase